jgi:hypothetical protein
MEERRRMEEPSARQKAEEIAFLAERESAKLAAAFEAQNKLSAPKKRPKVGESALGPDGEIDYNNPPILTLPEGTEARFSVVNDKWEVSIVSAGARNVQK